MASCRSLFNRTGSSDHNFIGGVAHKSTVNRGTKTANCALVRSADRDLQGKNLVGSLDRFAKTNNSRDSVDLTLTHVYP